MLKSRYSEKYFVYSVICVMIHTMKPEARSSLQRAHITKELVITYYITSIRTNYFIKNLLILGRKW